MEKLIRCDFTRFPLDSSVSFDGKYVLFNGPNKLYAVTVKDLNVVELFDSPNVLLMGSLKFIDKDNTFLMDRGAGLHVYNFDGTCATPVLTCALPSCTLSPSCKYGFRLEPGLILYNIGEAIKEKKEQVERREVYQFPYEFHKLGKIQFSSDERFLFFAYTLRNQSYSLFRVDLLNGFKLDQLKFSVSMSFNIIPGNKFSLSSPNHISIYDATTINQICELEGNCRKKYGLFSLYQDFFYMWASDSSQIFIYRLVRGKEIETVKLIDHPSRVTNVFKPPVAEQAWIGEKEIEPFSALSLDSTGNVFCWDHRGIRFSLKTGRDKLLLARQDQDYCYVLRQAGDKMSELLKYSLKEIREQEDDSSVTQPVLSFNFPYTRNLGLISCGDFLLLSSSSTSYLIRKSTGEFDHIQIRSPIIIKVNSEGSMLLQSAKKQVLFVFHPKNGCSKIFGSENTSGCFSSISSDGKHVILHSLQITSINISNDFKIESSISVANPYSNVGEVINFSGDIGVNASDTLCKFFITENTKASHWCKNNRFSEFNWMSLALDTPRLRIFQGNYFTCVSNKRVICGTREHLELEKPLQELQVSKRISTFGEAVFPHLQRIVFISNRKLVVVDITRAAVINELALQIL